VTGLRSFTDRCNKYKWEDAGFYMRKLTGYFNAVAGRIIFIGFTVQIVLGFIWLICNFAHFQRFETVNSLLYPAILTAAEGMGKLIPIPYYCFVYVLQITVWFYAAYFFAGVIHNVFAGAKYNGSFYRVWAALAIVTAVPVMQSILALLPYALTEALMLWELGLSLKMVCGNKNLDGACIKQITAMSLLWFVQALLLHEYLLFGSLPIVIATLIIALKERRKYVKMTIAGIAALLAVSGMLAGIYGVCSKADLYEESNPEFIRGMFSRTALTTVLKNWDNWTEEIDENIESYIKNSASLYADNVALEFIPYVDEKYGDYADDFYIRTIKEAWELYHTQIIHEVLWDTAGYACSPLIIKRQLQGEGYASLTARNYDMMKRQAPIVTKYYVNFFLDWFLIAFLIVLVSALLKIKKLDKVKAAALLICIATYVVMCARYVIMGAGIMDYKRTAVITATWIALMLVMGAGALNKDKSGELK
jgi:hypothetical protein